MTGRTGERDGFRIRSGMDGREKRRVTFFIGRPLAEEASRARGRLPCKQTPYYKFRVMRDPHAALRTTTVKERVVGFERRGVRPVRRAGQVGRVRGMDSGSGPEWTGEKRRVTFFIRRPLHRRFQGEGTPFQQTNAILFFRFTCGGQYRGQGRGRCRRSKERQR
jgi:hypothetical protein